MGNTVRIRNGMSNATEGDILGSIGDIVKTLGVVDLAGGHLLVTADTPTGMTVQVAGGIVYVPNSNYDELDSDTPKFYPVVCDSEVITIDNNVSGSTRIDIVCVKVDKAIAPDADADNIATKVIVKGTPGGGTPSTPANHYKLAEITVVNGETAIENSMITDKRGQVIFDERYTKLTTSTPTNLTGVITGNGSVLASKTNPSGAFVGTTDTQTLTNKTLGSPLFQGTWDGWIEAGETWVYASADDPTYTFTISGDLTTKYQKGDKIKFTQATDGVKYMYIIGVSESGGTTTVTVTGGDDYDLDNEAITSPYFSKIENPQGFPSKFDWTPTFSASGSMTWTSGIVDHCYFKIEGSWITGQVRLRGTTGGTADTQLRFTLPFSVVPAVSNNSCVGFCVIDTASDAGYINISYTSGFFYALKYNASNISLGSNRYVIGNFSFAF